MLVAAGCFPREQFGENRDKQLTAVRDDPLRFLFFPFFAFFEETFENTQWRKVVLSIVLSRVFSAVLSRVLFRVLFRVLSRVLS